MPDQKGPSFPFIAPVTPQTDTRGRIIAAAGEVFAKNGYERTTTRGIAKAAGVSEVTLFRCFESKQNLFRAVLEAYGPPSFLRAVENQLTGDYVRDMRFMGAFFMKALMERSDSIALILGESTHFPEMRPLFSQMPSQLWQMLARYLQKKMDDGTVRRLHPEAAAQSFLGAIFSYCIGMKMLGMELKPDISEQDAAAQIVDIFIQGTMLDQSAEERRGKP